MLSRLNRNKVVLAGCRLRGRGFTLIELLVVIAIIALLIGILLPSLGAARGAARGVVNMVNLRSQGQGFELYVNDFDTMPPFRLPPGEFHPSTGRPRPRYHWFLGDVLGTPWSPRDETERAVFLEPGPVPRLENEVFLDPTQTPDDFVQGSTGEVNALRNGSYGYNYHYLGNGRVPSDGGAYQNWPVRLPRLRVPGRTVALADSLGNQNTFGASGFREHSYTLDPPRDDWANNRNEGFAQSSGKSPAHARHRGRATVSFLDGHVEAKTLGELGYAVIEPETNRVERDAGSNALWNGLGFDEDETAAEE